MCKDGCAEAHTSNIKEQSKLSHTTPHHTHTKGIGDAAGCCGRRVEQMEKLEWNSSEPIGSKAILAFYSKLPHAVIVSKHT